MMVGLLNPVAVCVAANVCPARRNSTAWRLAALSWGSVDLEEEVWGTSWICSQIIQERTIVLYLIT